MRISMNSLQALERLRFGKSTNSEISFIKKELKALEIIKKMVECGYLKWTYGELRTCGTNNGIAYPLDKEEDKFLREVLL